MLLALLLFLGAGFLVFSYLDGGESDMASSAPGKSAATLKNEKREKFVNKHLLFTNERMELQKQKMYLDNAKYLDAPSKAPQRAYQAEERLDLSQETHAADIAKELGRGEKQEEYNSPDDIVQRDLFEQQQREQYSEAYREEYARQFVENARKGGYKVILSEDLSRVLSVTPLRKPSQNQLELFGSQPGGFQ